MIKERSLARNRHKESHAWHMSVILPFRFRSRLRTDDLSTLAWTVAQALRGTDHELKVSHWGDVQLSWTELAPNSSVAHEQAVTRLSAALPESQIRRAVA